MLNNKYNSNSKKMSFEYNKEYKLDDICEFKKSTENNYDSENCGLFNYYTGDGFIKYVYNEVYNNPTIILGAKNKASIYYETYGFSCSNNNYLVIIKNEHKNNINIEYVYMYLYANIELLKNCFNKKKNNDLLIDKVKEINVFIPYKKIMSDISRFINIRESDIINKKNNNFENCKNLINSYQASVFLKDYFIFKRSKKTNNTTICAINKINYLNNEEIKHDINIIIKNNLYDSDKDGVLLSKINLKPVNDYYYLEELENVSNKYKIFIIYYIYLNKDEIVQKYYSNYNDKSREFNKRDLENTLIPNPTNDEMEIFLNYLELYPITLPDNITDKRRNMIKLYIKNLNNSINFN